MLRDEAELIAYIAAHGSTAVLVLRDAPDADAALAALRQASGEVHAIPHPQEPSAPLPNWCDAFIEDGEPVLHLDVQDQGPAYAGRITAAILAGLDAAGVDGRLEPRPVPGLPCDYDAAADLFYTLGEYLWKLDERGLPPGFPAGFPVPEDCEMVMAQRAAGSVSLYGSRYSDSWEYAAWRRRHRQPPLEGYVDELRAFGCALDPVPGRRPAKRGGMHGYRLRHPSGNGFVWLYHEWMQEARRQGRREPSAWYVGVVWQPAGTDDGKPLPEPAGLRPSGKTGTGARSFPRGRRDGGKIGR